MYYFHYSDEGEYLTILNYRITKFLYFEKSFVNSDVTKNTILKFLIKNNSLYLLLSTDKRAFKIKYHLTFFSDYKKGIIKKNLDNTLN